MTTPISWVATTCSSRPMAMLPWLCTLTDTEPKWPRQSICFRKEKRLNLLPTFHIDWSCSWNPKPLCRRSKRSIGCFLDFEASIKSVCRTFLGNSWVFCLRKPLRKCALHTKQHEEVSEHGIVCWFLRSIAVFWHFGTWWSMLSAPSILDSQLLGPVLDTFSCRQSRCNGQQIHNQGPICWPSLSFFFAGA